MTDHTHDEPDAVETTDTTAEPPQDPQEATPQAPDSDDATVKLDLPDHDGSRAAREAQRYRIKLREAETERDALRTQVTAIRREAVEGIAAQIVAKPQAIWATGLDVNTLLTRDGLIDADKARAAVAAVADELGLARHIGPRRASPAGSATTYDSPDRFVDAFKPPSKRHYDSAYSD